MAFMALSPLKDLPSFPLHFPATPHLSRTNLQFDPCKKRASTLAMVSDPMTRPLKEEMLSYIIEEKVNEAKKICEENEVSEECVVAWDEVEEVSQAKARLKSKSAEDPLHAYCKDHPDAPECRMYED